MPHGILLPIALAILLSFLLAPIVNRLESWRLGRILSVVVAVAIAFSAIAIIGYVMVVQFYDLAYELPKHRNRIVEKAQTFQTGGQGVFARLSATFDYVQKRLEQSDKSADESQLEAEPEREADPPPAGTVGGTLENSLSQSLEELANEGQAIPVEVVNSLSAREIAQSVLGPLMAGGDGTDSNCLCGVHPSAREDFAIGSFIWWGQSNSTRRRRQSTTRPTASVATC